MMANDIDNNPLFWLQQWYAGRCNGEWEYDYGVRIGTLGNPGWSLVIDLAETKMGRAKVPPIEIESHEFDWLHCRIRNARFEGFGGPVNLADLLETFRSWVEPSREQNTTPYVISSAGTLQSMDMRDRTDKGVLDWLQHWYHGYCDDEWEREKRIRIKTLDEPGWSMFVNLSDTELSGVAFAPLRMDRGQDGWIQCQVLGDRFKGTCGLHNLTELLATFRAWANSSGNGGGRNGS